MGNQDLRPDECFICERTAVELYVCEKCDNLYCDNCAAIYNQFTQIDYNCCKSCADQLKNQ